MKRRCFFKLSGISISGILFSAAKKNTLIRNDNINGVILPDGKRPWWDDYPLMINETDSPEEGLKYNSSVIMSGNSSDPSWGLFGHMHSTLRKKQFPFTAHKLGLKVITYYEAYGTSYVYLAQIKKGLKGDWIKEKHDASLTKIIVNGWNWQKFDGTGKVVWVGITDYYKDSEWARPYTRTHPRYGAPPLRYPDGKIALGYLNNDDKDILNSRILDASCAKTIHNELFFPYLYKKSVKKHNKRISQIDPKTGEPQGPLTGTIEARPGSQKYMTLILPGKDIANPHWIEYQRASIRLTLDSGLDGVWADNWSPWDNWGERPVWKAFGEWSVALFRDYLKENFSSIQLNQMGVNNIAKFDIREYLISQCKKMGGEPQDLSFKNTI